MPSWDLKIIFSLHYSRSNISDLCLVETIYLHTYCTLYYIPVLSLAMIKTVLPASLIMFVFRVINHFSVAISQAVMVLAYVIITIRPLVRSATVHTILFNQTFVSVKTEIVQVRYTLNNVIAIIEFMVKCQCNYHAIRPFVRSFL